MNNYKEYEYIYYDDLHIEFDYGPYAGYSSAGDPPIDDSRENSVDDYISYEYKVPKYEVIDLLTELVLDGFDDIGISSENAETYVSINYDNLLQRYDKEIHEYFEEDAKRAAIEEYDTDAYRGPDYDEFIDESYIVEASNKQRVSIGGSEYFNIYRSTENYKDLEMFEQNEVLASIHEHVLEANGYLDFFDIVDEMDNNGRCLLTAAYREDGELESDELPNVSFYISDVLSDDFALDIVGQCEDIGLNLSKKNIVRICNNIYSEVRQEIAHINARVLPKLAKDLGFRLYSKALMQL